MIATFDWLREKLVSDYKLVQDQIVPEALLEDLGLDSLALAELMFDVEDVFEITLPPDLVPLPRVADVVAFIDHLVEVRHGTTDVVGPSEGSQVT